MGKHIGVLTAGGDSPGLNAAIRAIGKAARSYRDTDVIGFRDGFRGMMENRTVRLDTEILSGILTVGGTILGTSRDKPHRMPVGGKLMDMTEVIVDNYQKHLLDVLVCLGGGGTQKNALQLKRAGLNIVTLPKTIDNDVAMTDATFGFDTALGIATEAIDRLHSTAHSHHRIIVVEIMGHRAGWLALGAGIAGGADVILIPEIPYHVELIAEAIRNRSVSGKHFSIVAVAEGALSYEDAARSAALQAVVAGTDDDQPGKKSGKDKNGDDKAAKKTAKLALAELEAQHTGNTLRLAQRLEELTGLETRLTILGYLQRGGTPSAADRLLATQLGTEAVRLVYQDTFGVMVAKHGSETRAVPLEEVAGRLKSVPLDHEWIEAARRVGTSLGD
jgi:6-phosphofructokinase 1